MKKIEIVILDAFTCTRDDLNWSALDEFANVTVYPRTPKELIVERAANADAVFTNKVPMFKKQLDALPNLKYIGILATGVNNVDLELAHSMGICVSNIPQYGTMSVAQAVFAHILNISNSVQIHAEAVERGDWCRSADICFCLKASVELAGKTLGVVGYGAIGRQTAKIASAFGMNVLAFSPSRKIGCADNFAKYASLDEIFSASDIISLNCPLNDFTKHIICAENIAKMKRGVWIINTGRGGLVDEPALFDALKSGAVGAAGLDVLSKEPPLEGNILIGAPNCFITPHNAWTSREARARLIDIAVKNVASWVAGKAQNVVNISAL